MPHKRQLSVGQNIKKILAEIFLGEHVFGLSEPGAIVTISQVKLSPDLHYATCYISYYTTQKEASQVHDFFEKLDTFKGAIRKQLAQKLRMKFVPELIFKYDESYAHAQHIDSLLHAKSTQ